MTDENEECRDVDDELVEMRIINKGLIKNRNKLQKKEDDHEWNIAFQSIEDHRHDASSFSQGSSDVGSSGIMASVIPDVDSMYLSDDDSAWDASEKIAEYHRTEYKKYRV